MELVKSSQVENILCLPVQENEVEEIIYHIVPGIIELIRRIERQSKGKCAGLAAPQVGIRKKFFVRYNRSKYDITKDEYRVYFNSYYIKKSDKTTMSLEGCYSYDSGKKQNYIKRYKRIIFFGYEWDIEQKKLIKFKRKIDNWEAIVLQHEIDHCGNGDGQLSKTIFCR